MIDVFETVSRGSAARLPQLCDVVAWWCERSRSRRELLKMDHRMREDIGVTEADVWHEARLWFWQS